MSDRKKASKGSTQVDVVGRIIDFWWHRIVEVKPKSRVKPSISSPGGRKVASILKAGYSEHDCKQAVEGCFLTPHNMGHNNDGQLHLGLSLIFRNPEQVDRFIHNSESPPSAPKMRKSSHSDVLKQWKECRTVIDTRH